MIALVSHHLLYSVINSLMLSVSKFDLVWYEQDLVAKLPDRGEKMRNQLAELQLKLLGTSDSSPVNLSSEKKRAPEVISVDEIADNLDVLSV